MIEKYKNSGKKYSRISNHIKIGQCVCTTENYTYVWRQTSFQNTLFYNHGKCKIDIFQHLNVFRTNFIPRINAKVTILLPRVTTAHYDWKTCFVCLFYTILCIKFTSIQQTRIVCFTLYWFFQPQEDQRRRGGGGKEDQVSVLKFSKHVSFKFHFEFVIYLSYTSGG